MAGVLPQGAGENRSSSDNDLEKKKIIPIVQAWLSIYLSGRSADGGEMNTAAMAQQPRLHWLWWAGWRPCLGGELVRQRGTMFLGGGGADLVIRRRRHLSSTCKCREFDEVAVGTGVSRV